MVPKAGRKSRTPRPEAEDISSDPPTTINPYEVLDVGETASQDQIKSAYRKSALKYHPDKASLNAQEEANKKFQEIAFAYAILSDEKRRRRYDTTGNTAESLNADDDDFDWVDFFREQTAAMVDGNMIEKIKAEYQNSEEERADVLRVYVDFEGNMDAIYEEILCSNVLDDDDRFRKYIDDAIKTGQVKSYSTYSREGTDQTKARARKAKEEEQEAMQLAEELGVTSKLFGKSKAGKKDKEKDEDGLKALIQQRQQSRSEGLFERLEAKYTGSSKNKKGKRPLDEPPEELFAKNAKKGRAKR